MTREISSPKATRDYVPTPKASETAGTNADVIRQAFTCTPNRMPPALLPEERESGKLRYPLAPNNSMTGAE